MTVQGADADSIDEAYAYQCLTVVGGASYDASAALFLPTSAGAVEGSLSVWYYASSDCSGAILASFPGARSATVGAWQAVTASGAAPTSAHSMIVRLVMLKPRGQTAGEALFDDVLVNSP